jgi:succinate-semialdehyde dehydrogenase/glutarate-semialdehyde dehydrogenase
MSLRSINPATGETLRTFDSYSDAEVTTRLERAAIAAPHWASTAVETRLLVLARAAQLLDQEADRFARLMTLEMGKPLAAAREEAAKCAFGCRYYVRSAASFLAPEPVVEDGATLGRVLFRPLGVVLAIMPWNFPFWQVIRFAAPAIAAGNAGLLKHASNVPQCAIALEQLFTEAGAPPGVFQTLLIGSDRVERLIVDDRIAAVTLTGSEPAGRQVAAAAGRAIKKTVLELGGSDPFIVLPSADVAQAASVAVRARLVNNGQSCIAAKRFIVAQAVAEEFEQRFVAGMRALRVGDPMAADTDVGPLATAAIRDELDEQVRETVARGARIATGGHRLEGPGFFYAPTVLTDIPPGSPAARDELFGPVASVFRVRDADHALRLANDSTFGLAASVWTREADEARRFAEELETGQVFVNAMVASDPRFPFGGVKRSGYGRELGPWGLREFVNIKTVRGNA